MAPFGIGKSFGGIAGGNAAQPTDEELRAAAVDLDRIRQGGIPLGAEERLKRVGAAKTPFFTSDLTAKEYALTQGSGLQPVAQVMGSSVVQHGWGVNQAGGFWGESEVHALSDPWNMARDRAFGRLRQEAEFAGADTVLGVELNVSNLAGDANNIEFVVFGTAVRDLAFPPKPGEKLGLSTLSGQEVEKIRRVGGKVAGVVGHTTVLAIRLNMSSNWIMNSGGFSNNAGNVEIPEISQGVYDARGRAMNAVRRQANEVDANAITISTLKHSIEHREYDGGGGQRINYFYITMNVLGTALKMGTRQPFPAPFIGPGLTINLRDKSA